MLSLAYVCGYLQVEWRVSRQKAGEIDTNAWRISGFFLTWIFTLLVSSVLPLTGCPGYFHIILISLYIVPLPLSLPSSFHPTLFNLPPFSPHVVNICIFFLFTPNELHLSNFAYSPSSTPYPTEWDKVTKQKMTKQDRGKKNQEVLKKKAWRWKI